MGMAGVLIVAVMVTAVLLPAFLESFRNLGEHQRMLGNIVNHDPLQREFWYSSPKKVWEILRILEKSGVYEEYSYHFDRERMTLILQNVLTGYKAECVVFLEERDNGTRIRLYWTYSRLEGQKMGTEIIFYENFFCRDVLEACPIPYDKTKA